MHRIAVFGGTFDPIHNGHLQISINLQKYFKFDSYFFIPCKVPTIKPVAHASSEQRIEMIRLAIKDCPNFKLDLREIERPTPSYTVDTLESLRAEYPNASISLIIGYDAFLTLHQWHQWEKIITLSHLIAINRSEFSKQFVPTLIKEFLDQYQNKVDLLNTPAGSIYLFDAGNYNISSNSIREQIKKGADVKNKLPYAVYEYIKCSGLYTPKG